MQHDLDQSFPKWSILTLRGLISISRGSTGAKEDFGSQRGNFGGQLSSIQLRSSFQLFGFEKSIPSSSIKVIRHLKTRHYRWLKSNLNHIFNRKRLNALSGPLPCRFRIRALISNGEKNSVFFSSVVSCQEIFRSHETDQPSLNKAISYSC